MVPALVRGPLTSWLCAGGHARTAAPSYTPLTPHSHRRIPLYYELKLCLIIWMIAPTTRGAEQLYNQFVWPFLHKYASKFDPTFRSDHSVRSAAAGGSEGWSRGRTSARACLAVVLRAPLERVTCARVETVRLGAGAAEPAA